VNDEYMVVLVKGEFQFRRIAAREIRVIRGITEYVKKPELYPGEVLAITYPPDGIYRIVTYDD
jgi:hypothetical protein